MVISGRSRAGNPLRWVCADLREYLARRRALASQGFILDPDPYDRY